MNKDIILKMVEPNVKDGAITYKQFCDLFDDLKLSKNEKLEIVDVLYEEGIEVRDYADNIDAELYEQNLYESLDDSSVENDESIVSYDDSLFTINAANAEKEVLENQWANNSELCVLAQQGNQQALERLCINNSRLVAKCATTALKYMGSAKLDYDDLYQAGMMGLIEGINRFDPTLGYSFSTYVIYWIRQKITREIDDTGYTIRIPVHMMEVIRKVRRLYGSSAIQELDSEERKKKIAEECGVSINKVEECLSLLQYVIRPIDLDVRVGEDNDSSILDIVPFEYCLESPEEYVNNQELKEVINSVLKLLTPRERKVLQFRFGLIDGKNRTLEEVGKEFGVTRERIRQIEAKALRKLKSPMKSKLLKEYIEND